MVDFQYQEMLPLGADETPYRLVTTEGVSTTVVDGRTILKVEPSALSTLAYEALRDISH